MIDSGKLEAALKRMPGFEKLAACDRLSGGASRETYRLHTRVGGAEKLLALRRAPQDGKSALGRGPSIEVEA
jgi:hypothetical protein